MKLLFSVLKKFFGSLLYTPAPWMSSLASPRFFRVILPILLLGIGVMGYGYYWYRTRPQPNYVVVSVTNPPATALEQDATPQPATISFSRAVFRPEFFEKNIADKFQITPPLQGSITVSAADRLTITPDKTWQVGVTYTLRPVPEIFDRKALFQDKIFSFTTAPLSIAVSSFQIEEDAKDPLKRTALASVRFSHLVDRSAFEKRLRLSQVIQNASGSRQEEILQPTVTYADKGDTAFVRSPNLSIPALDGKIVLTIEKGVSTLVSGKAIEQPIEGSVILPGADNYFKVQKIEVRSIDNPENFTAERIVTVATSSLTTVAELAKHTEAFLLPLPEKKETADTEAASTEEVAPADESRFADDSMPQEGQDQYVDPSEASPTQTIESAYQNPEFCPVRSPIQVTDALLQRAEKVSLKRISEDRPFTDTASFRFQAPKDRCLYVRFNAGAKSVAGVVLSKTKQTLHALSAFPGAVNFLHKGSILSIAGDKKLTFYARNVSKVKLQLFRMLPQSVHHLVSQSYGSFSNPLFNYNFGPENIAEVFNADIDLPSADEGSPAFSTFDFTQYIKAHSVPQGLFLVRLSPSYDKNGEYFPDVNRIILFTDLGFIVKTNIDRSRLVLVSSLKNQVSLANVSVELLGKNGLPIFSGITDSTGTLPVPSVDQFRYEKEPLVWVVKKDDDISFMPYARQDRDVNLSRYDIGGIYSHDGTARDLQSYLFTDRGIYRPGETVHLQSITKRTDWQALQDKLPLIVSIDDPRGKTILEEPLIASAEGFDSRDFLLHEDALTGRYHWKISMKRRYDTIAIGEGSFKVEDFEPDRIKIDSALITAAPDEHPLDLASLLWIEPSDLRVTTAVKNMFGTVAVGNHVRASLQLKPSIPLVAGFPGYAFVNPYVESQSFDEELGDVETNEQGTASFALGLSRFKKALYRLVIVTEAQEKSSGKKVYTQLRTTINPLPHLYGFKSNGNLNFIRKQSDRSVHLIAVNNRGKKEGTAGLTARVSRYETVSVLTKTERGSYAYEAQEKKELVQESPLAIPQEGLTVPLGSFDVGVYGYELIAQDGTKVLEFRFRVVGDTQHRVRTPRVSEVKMTLEKKDFKPNETIAISLQAPYPGSGFITIEKDRVYASKFFSCTGLDCMQQITMPEKLEGNGYVTVTYVRSIDSDDIFTNPFSAATESISVNQERRTLPVSVAVPEKIHPGETVTITASSARPSKAIIYAVDEGILQVARYKKPDPFSVFYAKRALEVSTAQILDLLLPEYEIERRLSAAGGDDDAILGKVKNPFKRKGQPPVVFSTGIVQLQTTPQAFRYTVPDYFNGTLKVFVVAVDTVSVGVKEAETIVQGNLILQPSMPVVAAPGDTFPVATLVNNLRVNDPNIILSYEINPLLERIQAEQVRGSIPVGTDGVLTTTLRAGKDLGEGSVNIIAKNPSGAILARSPLTISIRPPVGLRTTVTNQRMQQGTSTLKLSGALYQPFAQRYLKVAKVPSVFLEGLSLYLQEYPYGCSEQIISQLAYRAVTTPSQGSAGVSLMSTAFSLLAGRTQSDGGLALWDGGATNKEVTLHQAFVFSELERMHVTIPAAQRDALVQYLESVVNLNPASLSEATESAQAIYFLTQFGSDTAERTTALRENLKADKRFAAWTSSSIALYIAATFEALQMRHEADALIRSIALPKRASFTVPEGALFYDFLSDIATYQLLLRRHFAATYNKMHEALAGLVAEELLANKFSTYSAARLLLANHGQPVDSEMTSGLSIRDDQNRILQWNSDKQAYLIPHDAKTLQVTSPIAGYVSIFDKGFATEVPQFAERGIEISKEILQKDMQPAQRFIVGEDYTVRLNIRSTVTTIPQAVITDLLAAGFEIVPDSMIVKPESGRPQFVQWRDDRATFFGAISPDVLQISYRIRAISAGTFAAPPAVAESMYAFDVYGVSKQAAQEITIADQ